MLSELDLDALIIKLRAEAVVWADCHTWPGWPPPTPDSTLYGQAALALEELRRRTTFEKEYPDGKPKRRNPLASATA